MSTISHYIVVDDGTDKDRWLLARRPYCGASETAAILGLSPYSSPRDVWLSKQDDAQPMDENRFTTWGTRLESVVADWAFHDYPDILGEQIPTPGLLASVDYPMIAATPDRLAALPSGETGVVEIKTGSEYTKRAWFDDVSRESVAPLWYEVQVQQQLFVGGWEHGYIAPLIGGNDLLFPRPVTFNPEFMDMALDEVTRWWERHIIGGEPPAPTDRDDLQNAFTAVGGSTIEATPEIERLIEERRELDLSGVKKRDDAIKDQLRLFMGPHEILVDADGKPLVTWKAPVAPRRSFDMARFQEEHPKLHAKYVSEQPASRSMRFTTRKGA